MVLKSMGINSLEVNSFTKEEKKWYINGLLSVWGEEKAT